MPKFKSKLTREEQLQKKREAEQERYYKIKNDPAAHEEQKEKERQNSEPSFVELSPRFKNTNDCKDSQASTPDLESEPIIVGAWVAVVYDENWFPGLIEEINDDNLKINFMLRNGSRFYWPNIPDIQEVPKNGILCLIRSPPSPITSRYFITASLCDINLKMKNISCT
ncbi:hypothetical protein AVEN_7181-1 [Araneus ventricosus]|uniref:Tudor domain-containing protein n=1 Tax=Araneus ventricosus TaxID=182803 RepID=A0A4Y2V571_ARAVE|nr:hypothetical protein AVEN_7181-1 [Araneus ventricosus]